jgi:hypothetical protein
MTDTQTIKEFFTEEQWDLIYEFVGRALDDDNYDSEQVYDVRSKIHDLFLN